MPTDTRNFSLDFVKGLLVIAMLIYHWLNYFIGVGNDFYRYLRFIAPGFIFTSGFVCSNIYITRYINRHISLFVRLISRGMKLIFLFVGLNLSASLMSSISNTSPKAKGLSQLIDNSYSIFVTGNNASVAFAVLLPLGYSLLGYAIALMLSRFSKHGFASLCIFGILAISVSSFLGLSSEHLQNLGFGLFGSVLGFTRTERLDKICEHVYIISISYLVYMFLIRVLGTPFSIQMIGTFLVFILFYSIGIHIRNGSIIKSIILLLGRYSLLSYIAQIFILQLAFYTCKAFHYYSLSTSLFALALSGALTFMTIVIIDRSRARSRIVDQFYRVIFA